MKKQSVITFKVDSALAEMLDSLPNRSEFIRNAVLEALENTCPLCQGSGILSEAQKKHWEVFTLNHHIAKCEDCKEVYLVCDENH